MAEALIKHLALVSESARVDLSELTIVAAALQKQVLRDLCPIWGILASVQAFAKLEDVPLDYWPMVVRDDIGYDAAGIHLDNDGQPFALISSSDDNDVWSLTASHETLEILVDPMGDRLVAGDSPKADQGRVLFLVEVSDPSEAADFGYSVNGVLVSDFYTPNFFDPFVASGVRYSFTGAIQEPRQVLEGGYLSWLEPESGDWWQETWFDGDESTFKSLGPLSTAHGSIRSQIDERTGDRTQGALGRGRTVSSIAGLQRASAKKPAGSRAASLHSQINSMVTTGSHLKSPPTVPGRRDVPRRRPTAED